MAITVVSGDACIGASCSISPIPNPNQGPEGPTGPEGPPGSSLGINVQDFGATGDGVTDDTTAIQAALDSFTAPGTLVFPPGIYVFTTLMLRSGVDLLGIGGTLKVRDHVSDQNDNIAYYFVLASGVDDIAIRDLSFDGNQATNRPAVPGPSWVADILTMVGSRIRVIGCTFVDAPDSGIMFSGCTDSEVSGCYIDNCPDLGIYYNDTLGDVAENNLILGNRITRCQHGGIGIKRNASDLTVSGNTIRDCGNGVTLEDFGGGVHPVRVTVSGNRMELIGHNYPLSARMGIVVNAAHGSIIDGNYFDDVYGTVIRLSGANDCVVQGNQIQCNGTADPAANRGISFEPRDGLGCENNLVIGNVVRGTQAEAMRAMTGVGDHRRNTVAYNDLQSDAGDGLEVNVNWIDNYVEGNVLSGVGFDLNANIVSGTLVSNRWKDNRLVNGTLNGFLGVQTGSYELDFGHTVQAVGLAVPTIGTWPRGAIVWNYQPVADGDLAWICITAGTPGTWLALKAVPSVGNWSINGNLTFLGASNEIVLGDPVTAGNARVRFVKGGANNQQSMRWESGGALEWLQQHDTSENWNILDRNSAVFFQLQRLTDGGFVRVVNGLRIGAADGPTDRSGTGSPEGVVAASPGSTWRRTDGGASTTLYVKESGTGNTGWRAVQTA